MKAVRKRRAYEDIVDQIRKLIEKGRLRQGDQLPVEKELSETFKVSRLTVREAILSLETMNLVDRRQGNGTYVIASSEEALVGPLAAVLVQEKDSLLDVFAVREIIEPEIARLAAKNARPEQVADLLRIVEAQEREAGEREQHVQHQVPPGAGQDVAQQGHGEAPLRAFRHPGGGRREVFADGRAETEIFAGAQAGPGGDTGRQPGGGGAGDAPALVGRARRPVQEGKGGKRK